MKSREAEKRAKTQAQYKTHKAEPEHILYPSMIHLFRASKLPKKKSEGAMKSEIR